MDKHRYGEALRAAHTIAIQIEYAELAETLDAAKLAETLGPVLDPTAWLKNGDALQEDIQVLGILRQAQVELLTLRSRARRHPERSGQRSVPYSVARADDQATAAGDMSRVLGGAG